MTEETMETVRQEARKRLTEQKQWGYVCERAILAGHWDGGDLMREAEQDVLKQRPEAVDE